MLLLYSIVFIVSFIVLAKSGGMLVKLTSKIAAFLGVSEFLFSFVIIGIATSLPEIFISISAAISGNSVLAFGNVVGSNILYPTLLIGVTILIGGRIIIIGYKEAVNRTSIYAFGISLLPLAFMFDLNLSRMEGLILFVIFAFYIFGLIHRHDLFTRQYHIREGEKDGVFSVKGFFKNTIYLFLGFILLYVSSEGVVRSASGIAIELDVPIVFISIFLVAFGAALPEMVFSVQAALHGKKDLIMGNMLGSLTVNSAIALGAAAVINPVIIEDSRFFYVSALFALLALMIFGIFTKTSNALGRKEGIALIIFYILFVVAEFVIR